MTYVGLPVKCMLCCSGCAVSCLRHWVAALYDMLWFCNLQQRQKFCVLPHLTSMMCLASWPGRQHQLCMALCTMPSFFTLYLVSDLGCSTNACHCALRLVASCFAVLGCAVLCVVSWFGMQHICMAACAVPSTFLPPQDHLACGLSVCLPKAGGRRFKSRFFETWFVS